MVLLMVIQAAPALAQAQQEPVATVNTGSLNVRSGPGLNFGSIATLPRGFGVRMIARNENASWVLIQLTDGVTGWVNSGYLYTFYRIRDLPVNEAAPASPITPTARVTNAVNLNVRARPDPNADIVVVVGLNQEMALLGRSFDSTWAFIRLPDGRTGWVRAQYITGTVPVRSLAPADGSVVGPQPPSSPGAPSSPAVRVYTVQAGDTLANIARRFGVNMFDIAAANNLTNINRILVGQRIIIPLRGY